MKSNSSVGIAILLMIIPQMANASWSIMESPIGGYATVEASNYIPVVHSIHYSPAFECKAIYSYLTKNYGKETGNQTTNQPLKLQVDNGIIHIAPAGQDAFLTEGTVAVYIPIDESNLPEEIKRGSKLYLKANDESIIAWVSLKGSTKGMNEAKKRCMDEISSSQPQTQPPKPTPNILSIVPDLKNIEGLWIGNDQDPFVACKDEDNQYGVAIGRWEKNSSGEMEFGKGTDFRMSFYDSGCSFVEAKKQGSTYLLKSECSDEEEDQNGDTVITIISDSVIQVINPLTSPLTLVRCPTAPPTGPKPPISATGDVPEEFIGDWVPSSSTCSSPIKFRVKSKAAVLINDKDSEAFEKIDLCYSCEGGAKYDGNVIWLTPESDTDSRVPFIAYLNAGEKIGVTVVDIDVSALKKRFPLDELELKKCKQ